MSLTYKKNRYQGFTILELLVVIAIISILAAVVLVALNQSRSKGNDAAIKAQLVEARKQAELYYENMNGRYCDFDGGSECLYSTLNGSTPDQCGPLGEVVFSDSLVDSPHTIGRFITAAEVFAPSSVPTMCFMDNLGQRWAIAMKLNNPVDGWWCIDSVGAAKLLQGTDAEVQFSINESTPSQTCP